MRTLLLVSLLTGVLSGCRSELCVRGETEACTCERGARGARSCAADGRFGACVCTLAGTFTPADASASRPKDAAATPNAGHDAAIEPMDAPGSPPDLRPAPDLAAPPMDVAVDRSEDAR
jgi:hypothetical protein